MSPAILAGLVLTLVLGAIEWRRADRANLPLRLMLVCVAAAAFAFLAATEGRATAARDGRNATTEGRATGATFIELDAPTEVAIGEALPVRGRVTLGASDSAWVRLQDPAGVVDSARIAGDAGEFTLTARPRAEGALLYRVTLASPGGEVTESLGVAVHAVRPPTLLILDGSPSFETAYLKRWLEARGASLTVRTTLTRDRSRIERVNGAPDAAGRITAALLSRVDAVVIDSAALVKMPGAEARQLLDAVTSDGLGVLLTGTTAATPLFSGFTTVPPDSAALEHRLARVSWSGMPRRAKTAVEVAPAPLRHRAGLVPLMEDETGAWLGAAQNLGEGRLAVSLVRTPSRWRLEGEDDLFASYWSLLLGAVARDTATEVRIEGGTPRADGRMEISLLTGSARPELSAVAPGGAVTPVALARDPFDSRRWRGSFWPSEAGWHTLRLAERTVPFLVLPARPEQSPARAAEDRPARSSIAAFLILLAALTILWAESRRRATGAAAWPS